MKDVFLNLEKLRQGLYMLDDTTKAPFGSALKMNNCQVTDRGGIGPRPGTRLLGIYNSSSHTNTSLYNFKKSFDSNEILIKTYDTNMEVYSKNNTSADWFKLKTTFTADKEFGFVTSLVNTDKNDYVIFNNRYDEYSRWQGAITQLNGALVGGETNLIVDSLLTSEIFYSGTATANTATTLDIGTTPWATSQWVKLFVYIPSTGKVRLITANTSSQITFDTLGGAPGNVAFQIRQLAFPQSGTVIYNGTTMDYTTIDIDTRLPVASAVAAPDNTGVALVPAVYPANPRGNRLTNYLNRIIVGNVRSAMALDSGGALQGYSSAGSYFVSKVNTPTDFTYDATRIAGQGDVVGTPYGGGDITDVVHQEEEAYIFKKNYIESIQYSQDANDLAVRTPLKQNIGSIGKVIKASDDIYFFTEDKKFTSIGRVKSKDLKPQTENIGYRIKRFIDACDLSSLGRGIEYKDKLYIPLKSSSVQEYNDKILVYNKNSTAFEGVWDIPAQDLARFNDGLYFAESNGANVYEMLTNENADVVGTERYGILADFQTNFFNLTSQKNSLQAMNGLILEGYIRGGTTITFNVWKEFSNEPFLTFIFSSDETGLLDGETSSAYLGGSPLAINAFGTTFSEPGDDGRRHFQFTVYFPFQYGNFFSVGHSSSEADDDYEITRYGLLMKEDFSPDNSKIKSI